MGSRITVDKVHDVLKNADIQEMKQVWSSNYVFLVTLENDNGTDLNAIYKPQAGDTPLWDFPQGTLYKREVAAYELSLLLGWEFVPPTVVRNGPEGIGSVQLFIPHDQSSHFFEQREQKSLITQLKQICVFDALSNNADRKGGHCLLDNQEQIWGIDHGLCFHSQNKLRTVIWDWSNELIPDNLLADIQKAHQAITDNAKDSRLLYEMLDETEIEALLNRAETLLAQGRYPFPSLDSPYPWPLI